jgi:hypothetical protein
VASCARIAQAAIIDQALRNNSANMGKTRWRLDMAPFQQAITNIDWLRKQGCQPKGTGKSYSIFDFRV